MGAFSDLEPGFAMKVGHRAQPPFFQNDAIVCKMLKPFAG